MVHGRVGEARFVTQVNMGGPEREFWKGVECGGLPAIVWIGIDLEDGFSGTAKSSGEC